MIKNDELIDNNELTLKKLFYDSMGLAVDIKTYNNPLKGEWLVYEKLNIIAPRFPTLDMMKFVLAQYDTRGGIHKILLRKLARIGYLGSMGLLAVKSMNIEGIDSMGKNMIFWWRGRSMRLFDFSTGMVTCTVKEGLPKYLFTNAVSFRNKYKYTFMLDLIDSGSDWFREEILSGCTLGRIKNKEAYKNIIDYTINCMKELGKDTISYRNHKDYINELHEEINNKLLSFEKEKLIHDSNLLRSIIDILCLKAEKLNMMIPIVLSHGDLHPANVLVSDQNNTYIIDWEANLYRSIWYDPATLLCNFRSQEGRKQLLTNSNNPIIKDKVLINDRQKEYDMESVTAILLLEYLKELMQIMNFQRKGHILDNFAQNLNNLLS